MAHQLREFTLAVLHHQADFVQGALDFRQLSLRAQIRCGQVALFKCHVSPPSNLRFEDFNCTQPCFSA